MLFSGDVRIDYGNLLRFLDKCAQESHYPLVINDQKAWEICTHIYNPASYLDGWEKASCFKKAAQFLSLFLGEKVIALEEIYPPIPDTLFKGDICAKHYPSAIAFDITRNIIKDSSIDRGGKKLKVSNLSMSDHSYIDLMDVLASGITENSHSGILALFLEQLAFKDNPFLEYSTKTHCP